MLFNQLHVPPFNNQWMGKVEFWLVYKQIHKIKITGKHALYIGQSYIWSRKIYTSISLLNIFLYIYIFLFFLLIRAYSFILEYSDKNVISLKKKGQIWHSWRDSWTCYIVRLAPHCWTCSGDHQRAIYYLSRLITCIVFMKQGDLFLFLWVEGHHSTY